MPDPTAEATPSVIPAFKIFRNQDGLSANFQPEGETETAQQAFFSPLGTNVALARPVTNRQPVGPSHRGKSRARSGGPVEKPHCSALLTARSAMLTSHG